MEIKLAVLEREKKEIVSFLESFGLCYDKVDMTIYASENNEIIGTVSAQANIIKDFAVRSDYQGQSLAAILLSEMINLLAVEKIYYLQVYTKPPYREVFESLHFREIVTTADVCLLESRHRTITEVLKKLKVEYNIDSKDVGCAVMNCNPFTLGHRYLIEEASSRHELFLVFIVETDQSYFHYHDRLELVRQGTKDLKNVIVLPSTDYLISGLTFPTYFLKADTDEVLVQAECDAKIFSRYFMEIFGISKRYLGTETDPVTAKYNEVLKKILKDKVEVIERVKSGGVTISASLVRKYLKEGDFEKIAPLVPKTTLEFLKKYGTNS
ncbi:MAG: [citrate (pro-3S)-lyase] ligase [Acholeplasmataceae bacterium]|nr:[citrate (pro-3S)-lyase] ligase [Acholeplasmataceae bacterium]